jgi:hypothetical protein
MLWYTKCHSVLPEGDFMKYRMGIPVAAIALAFALPACTNKNEAQDAKTSPVVTAPPEQENVEAKITELEKEWAAAIEKKDVDALDRLLAPEFAGTSPTAHTFMKIDAINDLKKGTYVVEKMTLDEISVNVFGNTAVSFTSSVEPMIAQGIDLASSKEGPFGLKRV